MANNFNVLDRQTITADDVTTTDDLVVGDDATVTDDLLVSGDLAVTGTTALTGALTVAGNTVYPAPAVPADHGLIQWNMPVTAAASSVVMTTAGTLYLNRIRRVPPGTVTNLVTLCSAAGNTLTANQCFGALFTAAGALVGQTGSQAVAWASTGVKTMALASPAVVTAGDYYVGLWFNGTTGPSFLRMANATGNAFLLNPNLSAPNLVAASADTGLTTTAPDPFGAQTVSTLYFWVALS